MGNWGSYVLRRSSDGVLAQADSNNPGANGWMCWILAFQSPDELAQLAGAGPALLVSEADSGMAAVVGREGGRTSWEWVFNEAAYYGDGYHGDGPAPAPEELEASRPQRAIATAERIADWARLAGLPDPDRDELAGALSAHNVFAMESVRELFIHIGVWADD